jgi:hypothetical protein
MNRATQLCPRAAAPAGNPPAIAVGRLHGNKGFELLLEVLAATRRVELWIAGGCARGSRTWHAVSASKSASPFWAGATTCRR